MTDSSATKDPASHADVTAGELVGPVADDVLKIWDGNKRRWMTNTEARHYLRNLAYEFYVWSPAKPSQP